MKEPHTGRYYCICPSTSPELWGQLLEHGVECDTEDLDRLWGDLAAM